MPGKKRFFKKRTSRAGKEVCNNKKVSAKFSKSPFEEFPTFQRGFKKQAEGKDLLLKTASFFPAGALQIENSEETDQGKYECVATNSQGVRYSSPANLYVRGRT